MFASQQLSDGQEREACPLCAFSRYPCRVMTGCLKQHWLPRTDVISACGSNGEITNPQVIRNRVHCMHTCTSNTIITSYTATFLRLSRAASQADEILC